MRRHIEVVLLGVHLAELLPSDRILAGLIVGLVEQAPVDRARHALLAEVEITELVARVVAICCNDSILIAGTTQETTHGWLGHITSCISSQFAIPDREMPNIVPIQALDISGLSLKVERPC